MSEHKRNPMAVMADTGTKQLGAELMIGFSPKANILILPPDRIRRTNDVLEVYGVPPKQMPDGSIIPGDEAASWHVPPSVAEVYAEGERLAVEKLDITVNLVATAIGGLAAADGRVVGRRRHLTEVFREDAQAFLASLGGPSTAPS